MQELKKRKCIEHIDHCKKCEIGLSTYHETTLEDYAKGEPDYAPEDIPEKYKDNSLCTKCQETKEEMKINNKTCVWKPIKTEEFTLQEQKLRDLHGQCEMHDWHCEVCGVGIKNEACGSQIMTAYTWHGAQELAYQEIDHYKCNQCSEDAQNMLPHNSSDWHRKQSYLDFLFEKRSHTNTDDCKLKRKKKD